MKKNKNCMSMAEHLAELRQRLVECIGLFLITLALIVYFRNVVFALFLHLGEQCGYSFLTLAPQEILIQEIRVIFVTCIVLLVPVFVLQAIRFVLPVFTNKKAIWVIAVMYLSSLALYVIGLCFVYKVLMPFILKYCACVSMGTLNTSHTVSVENYVSLMLTIHTTIAAVFQLPLVVVALAYYRIVTYRLLKAGFGFSVVAIFLVSALITPPDVFSQLMVALPILAIYLLSMAIVRVMDKRYNKIMKET